MRGLITVAIVVAMITIGMLAIANANIRYGTPYVVALLTVQPIDAHTDAVCATIDGEIYCELYDSQDVLNGQFGLLELKLNEYRQIESFRVIETYNEPPLRTTSVRG